MSERELQAAVLALARLCGWLAYHTHDSRRSEPGFPDLVLVRGDRVLFRELKTDTGKLSPAQVVWFEALNAAGTDTDVWRPADWTSGVVERVLARRDKAAA